MLQTFLILIYSFFKIGLLTIGGGLVIVPIIQREMAVHGWMRPNNSWTFSASPKQRLVLSESTPPPLSATASLNPSAVH